MLDSLTRFDHALATARDNNATAEEMIALIEQNNREDRMMRYLDVTHGTGVDFWSRPCSDIARLRMAGIACRIEEFRLVEGRLPESLGELGGELPRDPFNGEAFSYQFGEIAVYENVSYSVPRTGKDLEPIDMIYGYRLWSVGKNRQDDGGKFDDDDVILTVKIIR